jgi:sugar/nucleoside kinase (ribokinase family)
MTCDPRHALVSGVLDVYCFGHVSTGKILRLKGRYPEPDGYAEVAEVLENHSGEATGTALTLAKLGARVALEGNWIGDTSECRRTLEFLRSRGIDCSGLVVKPGYGGVAELVISDGTSRTVFGRYIDLLFTERQWELPNADKIRAARIVCVDPAFGEATLAVARVAQEAGRLLVTCDTGPETSLASLAGAIVVSGELIRRERPEAIRSAGARAELFSEYLDRCPGLVVFTAGADSIWFGRGRSSTAGAGRSPPGERMQMQPYQVQVVDSAGAGDSFRGGLTYGLLQGWSDADSVRFASAVAALVCTTAPGCRHAPDLVQVSAFLAERGAPLTPEVSGQ